MPSSTNSGASAMRGRSGTSASTMPAMTRRIDAGVFSRRAATATTTSTPSKSRMVSMVSAMRRPLQKTLRIDVDIELDGAAPLRRLGEEPPQIGREIVIARRFQEKPHAVAAANERERRFGRAEQAHAVLGVLVDRGRARQLAGIGHGLVLVGAGDDDRGEPSERRVMRFFAQLDFGVVERLTVLRHQGAHHRMVGLSGLQEAAADAGIAAGAADDLMQQLEGALGGARVAVAQAQIAIDHADEV